MGASLQQLRRREGLTREELARKAGVSPASVAELEREDGGATTVGVLRKVASALGRTVGDIFLP